MSNNLNEITSCEVCGSSDLRLVLDLGEHPMCDDLVAIGDPRECQEYPIQILFCDKCYTGHQHYQIPKQELFPSTYHYRSRHTADVLNGMRQLVMACEGLVGSYKKKKVLDIGCNDGSLLSIFSEQGAETFGIEPTGAAKEALESGHQIIQDFLSEEVAKHYVQDFGHPDVITFTNVFAHIEDLNSVINALKILSNEETVIVIENHYLGSVLERNQFDTFYHEHPRTYSYTSFVFIAEALDMRIGKVEFPQRYGGNIRVFLTQKDIEKGHDKLSEYSEQEQLFGGKLENMSTRIGVWREKKLQEIETAIERHGKLAAKAFPGRAAIPLKLLGLDERHIIAAFEKPASGKIGHYIPGTRIPILSDDEFESDEKLLINLAWHIADEIEDYMRNQGFDGEIINIISQNDF